MTTLILALLIAADPAARSGAGVARVGTSAYVFGGMESRGGRWARYVLAYDLLNKAWSEKTSLPEYVAFPATVAYGGKVYMIGGLHEDGTQCNHARVYDPSSNTWSNIATLPTPRSRATATVVQGKIAVIGGIAPESSINKNSDRVEMYDPASKVWSRIAPMPTARHGHVSEFVKDRLVVAGGYADEPSGQTTSVEVWDAKQGWTKGAPLPEPRGFAESFVYENEMWVFGNRGPAAHPVRYDAATNTWTSSKAPDNDRHRGGAVEFQGKVYLFFGEGRDEDTPIKLFDLRRDAWID